MKKFNSYFVFFAAVVFALTSCSPFIPVTGGTDAPQMGIVFATDTPYQPTPLPTAPPPKQTSNLVVNVSNLSKYKFEVRPNTDLTLSDTSTDGKSNACKISKSGFNLPVTIPVNAPSTVFQLGAGEYKLTCEIPNVSATISSK